MDVIVIGAGVAGCVAASTAARMGHQVTLLEQGNIPPAYPVFGEQDCLVGDDTTIQEENPYSLEWYALRSKVLGGGAAINGQVWMDPYPGARYMTDHVLGDLWYQEYQQLCDEIPTGELPAHEWGAEGRLFHEACQTLGVPAYPTHARGRGVAPLTFIGQPMPGDIRSPVSPFFQPHENLKLVTGVQVLELGRRDSVNRPIVWVQTNDGIQFYRAESILVAAGALQTPRLLEPHKTSWEGWDHPCSFLPFERLGEVAEDTPQVTVGARLALNGYDVQVVMGARAPERLAPALHEGERDRACGMYLYLHNPHSKIRVTSSGVYPLDLGMDIPAFARIEAWARELGREMGLRPLSTGAKLPIVSGQHFGGTYLPSPAGGVHVVDASSMPYPPDGNTMAPVAAWAALQTRQALG